jgi:molybdopterin-guanine dinucleotide biosynthesis protein A
MERLTAVVLAGGKSSRFGSDKASALLRGRPLLQWVLDAVGQACEAVVVVNARDQVLPEVSCAVPMAVVEDLYEAQGPLAGLVAAFEAVRTPLAFATSCDSPLTEPELIRYLASRAGDSDVVCPLVGGHPQPLVAVYRSAACLPVFRENVERGQLRIVVAYGGLRRKTVTGEEAATADPGLRTFLNANTPERLAEIDALLG